MYITYTRLCARRCCKYKMNLFAIFMYILNFSIQLSTISRVSSSSLSSLSKYQSFRSFPNISLTSIKERMTEKSYGWLPNISTRSCHSLAIPSNSSFIDSMPNMGGIIQSDTMASGGVSTGVFTPFSYTYPRMKWMLSTFSSY